MACLGSVAYWGRVQIVADLALRIIVSLAAGAMVRMLSVFGLLPLAFAIILLGVIAAVMSKGLKATRFTVVLSTSASYFVAWYFTQKPVPEGVQVNPETFDLVKNSLEVFAPFLTPVIGSAIMLVIEKQRTSDPVEEEITEESLLAEKLPEIPARDLYPELSDGD